MKKVLSIILALCMVFIVISTAALVVTPRRLPMFRAVSRLLSL